MKTLQNNRTQGKWYLVFTAVPVLLFLAINYFYFLFLPDSNFHRLVGGEREVSRPGLFFGTLSFSTNQFLVNNDIQTYRSDNGEHSIPGSYLVETSQGARTSSHYTLDSATIKLILGVFYFEFYQDDKNRTLELGPGWRLEIGKLQTRVFVSIDSSAVLVEVGEVESRIDGQTTVLKPGIVYRKEKDEIKADQNPAGFKTFLETQLKIARELFETPRIRTEAELKERFGKLGRVVTKSNKIYIGGLVDVGHRLKIVTTHDIIFLKRGGLSINYQYK